MFAKKFSRKNLLFINDVLSDESGTHLDTPTHDEIFNKLDNTDNPKFNSKEISLIKSRMLEAKKDSRSVVSKNAIDVLGKLKGL